LINADVSPTLAVLTAPSAETQGTLRKHSRKEQLLTWLVYRFVVVVAVAVAVGIGSGRWSREQAATDCGHGVEHQSTMEPATAMKQEAAVEQAAAMKQHSALSSEAGSNR
jgi:hypothetical protein